MGARKSTATSASTSPAAATGHELTVLEVIEETLDSKSVVLRHPEDLGDLFAYRPGQFLTFRIPSDRTGHVARSYSLSSAPGIDADLKVTIKRTADGYGSNWLCDNLASGSAITVLPPSGRFTPTGDDGDLLLFAAGSGITPIISILKDALHRSERSVVLFYANRLHDSVIFHGELADYCSRFRDRLTVIHWIDEQQGFASSYDVAKLAIENPSAEALVCGPGPFMDMVGAGLRSAGFPRERHHQEVFVSISGDPFELTPAVSVARGGPTVSTLVHLNGETHQFDWPAGQTLVDVLVARGVDVPFSCRSGECGSCACVVTSGQVVMTKSDILDPEDLADGYVLGCQSRPDSGPIEIEF